MAYTESLRSQENIKEMIALAAETGLTGFRLMIDPQKTTSSEAIIEDICYLLRNKKSGMATGELVRDNCYPKFIPVES
jgi:hypothetical protein